MKETFIHEKTFDTITLPAKGEYENCTFSNCNFADNDLSEFKIKKTVFKNSQLQETDFTETDLTSAVFDNCDLVRAIFDHTILEKADFRSSYNYSIDPETNRIKKARFSVLGISGLLDRYNIDIEN